jgi:hypothetical protein
VNVAIHSDIKDDAGSARLFLDLNNRKPISSVDKFRNEVLAQDLTALAVVSIVREMGLSIAATPSEKGPCAVMALKKLYLLTVFSPIPTNFAACAADVPIPPRGGIETLSLFSTSWFLRFA